MFHLLENVVELGSGVAYSLYHSRLPLLLILIGKKRQNVEKCMVKRI